MSNARYGLRVRNGLVQGITQGLAVDLFLLDTYPNAAAAYSLRKLRSAYTGNAIRVRRSNDNSEQDIGFGLFEIDTAALLSFVGANNGFVTTWYDQSGNNRNATQTTAANQPRIVSSGVIDFINNKPCLKVSGSETLSVPSSTAMFNFIHNGTNSSIHCVASFGTSGNPDAAYGIVGNALASGEIGFRLTYDDRASQTFNNKLITLTFRGVVGTSSITNISSDNAILPQLQNIISSYIDADNATAALRNQMYVNAGSAIQNNTSTTAPSASNASYNLQIFSNGNNTFPMTGTMQELIIYPTQPSQTGLRDNINSFYNAY
jgi:hypothetical protein